jgi:hypothetical protein
MQSSWESQIHEDLLGEFQNGYDGVLEEVSLTLNPRNDGVVVTAKLRAVKVNGSEETWYSIVVAFGVVSEVRIGSSWFVGGGAVLYDGGRLLQGEDGSLVLDLDPGAAWAATGERNMNSDFLVVGLGKAEISRR